MNSAASVTTLERGLIFSESPGDSNYGIGNGSSATGDTYSFGLAALGERAFGSLNSGSNNSTLGFQFTNNTGFTLSSFSLGYFGELWRLGNTGRADRLDFQYAIGGASWASATYTPAAGLSYTGPSASTAVGPYNGNFNRTWVSGTISGLSIAPGTNVYFRWLSFDAAGADDGLGLDDLRLSVSSRSLTWDADPSTAGVQDGAGIWSNGVDRFRDLTMQQEWDNCSPDRVTFGSGGGGGAHTVTVSGTVAASDLVFAASSPTYTLAGGKVSLRGTVEVLQDAAIESDVEFKALTTWTVASGATLAISGDTSGNGGLVKAGTGTLELSGVATHTGDTHVAAGTLVLAGGNPIPAGTTVSVASGATLSLAGSGNRIDDTAAVVLEGTQTQAGAGSQAVFNLNGSSETVRTVELTNGRVETGAGELTVGRALFSRPSPNSAANSSVSGKLGVGDATVIIAAWLGSHPTADLAIPAVVSGSASSSIRRDDAGWITFTADNVDFEGSLALLGGRTILVNAGRFPAASEYSLQPGSTLRIENIAVNDNNRLSNTAPFRIGGGTFAYVAQSVGGSSESLGSLTPDPGMGLVQVTTGTSGVSQLTFAGLGTRATGSSILFRATNSSETISTNLGVAGAVTPAITLTGQANGYIGGWAFMDASSTLAEFAYYDTTAAGGLGSIRAPNATEFVTNLSTPGANVRITATGSSAAPTGSQTYNSLNLTPNSATAATISFSGAGAVLTLSNGGLMKGSGTGIGTITGAAGGITSTTNELHVFVNAGSLNLSSPVVNNAGNPLSLTKSGSGTLNFTANTSATGTFTVNSGTVLLNSGGNANSFANVSLNGGTLSITAAERIGNASPVRMFGLAVLSVSAATETIGPLTVQGSAQVLGTATLALNGTVTRDASSGVGSILIGISTLNLSSGGQLFEIEDHPIAPIEMVISSTIHNAGGSGGPATSFTKSGTGALLVSGTSGWTGGTSVTGGTLLIGANSAFSASNGALTITNSAFHAQSNVVSVGTLSLSDGRLLGAGTITLTSGTTVSSGDSRITPELVLGSPAGARTFQVNGLLEMDRGMHGVGGAVIKTGSGTLLLAAGGFHSYTGTTAVATGTLHMDGVLLGAGGGVSVSAGAALVGSGTMERSVNVSGTLAPGSDSIGRFTVNDLTLNPGAVLVVQLAGDHGPGCPDGHDQVVTTGTTATTIGGATLSVLSFGGFIPSVYGTTYVIVNNLGTSPVSGIFSGLAEGTVFTAAGAELAISYVGGTGNDVVLTAVPEPSVVWLTVLGVLGVRPTRRAQPTG